MELISNFIYIFYDTYTYRVLVEMTFLFRSILPGMVIGLAISSFLVAWRPIKRLQAMPFFHGFAAVVFMAGVGILSPFCSYLAIPIAAALISGGIPCAPVFAFLCATPLMNPTLFAMTWSAFDWRMAFARALAALIFGILGGCLAGFMERRIPRFMQLNDSGSLSSIENHKNSAPFLHCWWDSFRHLGWFVIKYVTLGICLAAVVKEVIPLSWIEAAVGRAHGYGILVGALLGVPLYACGGGTIPLIQVLMNMGMSPGAALAFFIAGPATKIPTIAAMQMTMGAGITAFYVILSLLWSILAGLIFQSFY